MGYDIIAYLDVDQDKIEKYINQNNIDRINGDYNTKKKIVDYYKKEIACGDLNDITILYIWDRQLKLHKIFATIGVNFIRNDKRFTDVYYINNLQLKYNREFPFCLRNILHCLRTSNDAIKIADELSIFFADDEDLMDYANWLRTTSKYCIGYRLDY